MGFYTRLPGQLYIFFFIKVQLEWGIYGGNNNMASALGFFLILGPPGAPPAGVEGGGGPKMAQMAGTAGKFLDHFDTTTEEKREK
jgi:hypothetical protein